MGATKLNLCINKIHFYASKCSFIFIMFFWFKFWEMAIRVGLYKRKDVTVPDNRKDHVQLFQSFENDYRRLIYRPYSDLFNQPISSMASENTEYLERVSSDYNATFRFTGNRYKAINIGSYNYLGLNRNEGPLKNCIESNIKEMKVGLCSSQIDLGTTEKQLNLEKALAQFLGVEAAITFGMGFATNSTNIPALFNSNTLIINDEMNHASIFKGTNLSGSKWIKFKHNDMEDLEKKITESIMDVNVGKEKYKKIVIIVEGVYSMEGTIVKLPEVIQLKKKYKAYLYLDEAHSIGCMGEHGRGVVEYFKADPNDIDIWMGTFTKSFAASGGFIAGRDKLINYIKLGSPSYYYATPMSPCIVEQIRESLDIISGKSKIIDGRNILENVRRNTRYLRNGFKKLGLEVLGDEDSPVVPVRFNNFGSVAYLVRKLKIDGILTTAVSFPATPYNDFRIRFCISGSHTIDMLDEVLQKLERHYKNITIFR